MGDPNQLLLDLAQQFGPGVLFILVGIAFTQTGLVLGPLIPGNTLLFTAGILSASGNPNLTWPAVTLSFVSGGIIGNAANYVQGQKFGRTLFERRETGLISSASLAKTEAFFTRHGRLTMLFSPFVPFVRSFAPFVAGVSQMRFPSYFLFAALGVALWVTVLVSLGAGLGQIPWVKNNLGTFVIVIFVIISAQLLITVFRKRRKPAE